MKIKVTLTYEFEADTDTYGPDVLKGVREDIEADYDGWVDALAEEGSMIAEEVK